MKKKILASILAVSMIFSSMSFSVFADDAVAEVSDVVEETVSDAVETEDTDTDADATLADAETENNDDATTDSAVNLATVVTEGWKSGNVGGSTSSITGDYSSSVTIAPTAAKKGKWSGTSDEYGYYAASIDATKDFTFSADVVIDEMNVIGTGSSTQSSGGIAIFNDITSKTGNNVAVSLYAPASSDTYANFCANYRENATKRAAWSEPLSTDTVKLLGGKNSAPLTLRIAKRSNVYTISCGDNSYVVYDNGNIFSGSTIYPALFTARQCKATFNNISLDVEDRTVSSLEITNQPESTEYVFGTEPNLEGMVVTAKFSDGTSEVYDANSDGYAVVVDKNVLGPQTAYITKGGVSTPLQINYVKNKAVKINLVNGLVKNEYFIGETLQTKGLELEAEFLDGSTATLQDGEYELSLSGKTIANDEIITADMAKDSVVKAKFVANDSTEAGTAYAEIPVTIYSDYTIKDIAVSSKPVKTTYYIGEEIDFTGLYIKANFVDANGNRKYDTLSQADYVIDYSSFDKEKSGTYPIVVSYAADPSIKTTFNVTNNVKEIVRFRITNYPIMTYDLDETKTAKDAFKMADMEVSYLYSSGELNPIPVRKIIYAEGDEEVVNEDGEYDVDLTSFQVSKPSSAAEPTSFIKIVPLNTRFATVSLPVTVREAVAHYWKGTWFGESTSPDKDKVEGDVKNIEKEGSKATVSSTGGGGKISTDQDGMAFLYTRISKDENFRLSGDVTVTSYLTKDFNDTSRAGQEAFGIMARDNIMLKSAANGGITATASEAKKDENGEPATLNSGTVFCGNFILLGGCTFTSYPSDKTSTTYEKNRDLNRINLAYRINAQSWETVKVGSPTRSIPFPTMTDNMFQKNDKFRLTLEKVNGGYKATCYDYQTGKTTTRTYYYEDGEVLTTIDPDNIYVGFFAARHASINVENVELNITDPATDIVSRSTETSRVTPKLTFTSSEFVSNTDYNLTVKPTNKSGGYITIKQGDKTIVNNSYISKKENIFPTVLDADTETKFTFYYTPRIVNTDADEYEELTSTEEVVQELVVTHKTGYDDKAEKIYVSPDGSLAGDGTRENPYDIDTALGFVKRGQTIVMMDGVYYRDKTITVPTTKSGTIQKRIGLIADEGATPILDGQSQVLVMTLEASYWDVKGIHFRHSANNQRGFQLSGDSCVLDNLKFYDNGDTGFQLSRTDSSAVTMSTWPKNNLIKNCEVWNSADPSGINADGYGCKLTVGNGNKFLGCVSHHNLDDGWDLYTKSGTGPIGVVVIEDCISYRQGYQLEADGTSTKRPKGGHNGFKLGGEGVPVQHIIRNCKAFLNDATGYSSNSNPCLTARGFNTSYKNTGGNVGLYSETKLNKVGYMINGKPATKAQNYDIKGMVSYLPGSDDKVGAYTATDYNYLAKKDAAGVNASGDTVTEDFFVSLDMDAAIKDGHFAQDEEGNFITNGFLELTDAVKAKISSVEGYEDEDETSTTETTTEKSTESGVTGGGSAKRYNSSNSSSSSSDKTTEATTKDSTVEETTSKEDVSENVSEDATSKEDANTEDKTEATTESTVSANDFADLTGSWAKPYVEALVEAGIVNGVSKTEFAPNAKITRGDFTKMLVKALGLTSKDAHGFADVAANDYYNDEIAAAKAFGLVNGTSSTTFSPKANITRQDAIAIIARAIDALGVSVTEKGDLSKFTDAASISSYAKSAVETLVGLGFVNGSNGQINPKANITRAEASKLIYDLLQVKTEK